MRNLWLNSFLLLLLAACASKPGPPAVQPAPVQSSCLQQLKPQFSSVLYNTHVNVVGKHLSGLLLFKTMPDSSTRVVLTNEMGVKFFDFAYTRSGFKVIYCISQLNKQVVITQLRKDIALILMEGIDLKQVKVTNTDNEFYHAFRSGSETTYYITDAACTQLKRIETAADKKKKVTVNLTAYQNGLPDSVYIAHQIFEFNISLKQLAR